MGGGGELLAEATLRERESLGEQTPEEGVHGAGEVGDIGVWASAGDAVEELE